MNMKSLSLLVAVVLLLSSPVFAGDPECEYQCILNSAACTDYCGPFGGATCEEQCSNALDGCLSQCSQCPRTRDYSTTTILSSQHTGLKLCLEKSPFANSGFKFWEYFIRYRVTNYRETTQCNGTKTTTVLSTTDHQTYCMEESPILTDTCSPYLPRTGFNFCS